MKNEEYYPYSWIDSISDYKQPEDHKDWLKCPNCNLKPKVWEFDNGRLTVCGCRKDMYDHFSIYAESINSYITRHNGSALSYDSKELKNNWNHWVKTGEVLFEHASKRNDEKW